MGKSKKWVSVVLWEELRKLEEIDRLKLLPEKNLEKDPEKITEVILNFINERATKSQNSLNKIAREVKIDELL